ncbi:enhancer of mRNA-decapping protein 4 isoform X1 [Diorhabda sublineata]|uniref:enhancer of mRNA-decapping protein 4 isoform X1 n=2 Tax=Diorhabda sublineata TaxID=1163346 RepID=UPI0024E0CC9B|nr:enhancer of mRNA-decapping protein 4 isoform X1 [Diorhabda sublineata]
MTSPRIGPMPNLVQNIKYTGSDTEFCTDIKGENVVIHCSEGVHSHGSSKVKLIDRIDYNWEFRYYHGHLVAAHINGKVIAYGMKGKDGGMVRVTNQETGHRALIKNLKDDIKDISFAFSREEIILGCVDSEGNILVYQIDDKPLAITYTLLLHIYPLEGSRPKTSYRLIWCPFLSIDEEDGADDPEKMFVVLNSTKVDIFNVAMLTEKYGKGSSLDLNDSYEGYIEIKYQTEVVDAAFSSDGTAIAIASADGYVKFFQLYMFDAEKQKCLHEWRPHDGCPLSSIIFIDNVLEYSTECWKFTVTGANNNSEIKLWSCETWTCLQTIHFKSDPNSLISGLYLNISLDYTGQYLVVSDINNRVMYVLQLDRNDEKKVVHVTTLAEFLLPAPFLSFHILEAASRNVPFSYDNTNDDLYDERDDFDEDVERKSVCLKILVIQPKKFQECNISFYPETMYHNTLNNPSEKVEDKGKLPKLDDLQESVSLLIQQKSNSNLTLMTPDDFTPGCASRPNSVRNETSNSMEAPLSEVNDVVVENLIDFQRPHKDNFASGGSSPSREVQEILSLNNSNYDSQEFFENLPKMQETEKETKQDYSKQNNINYQEKLNNDIVWPTIPMVEETEVIKDEALRNELRLSVNEEKSQLQLLGYRINALENLIREQNVLIQKLHDERLDKDEYIKEIELTMSKQQLQIAKMLETSNQQSIKTLSEKLQQIITHEIKNAVLPVVQNQMETYRHQIESQYTQKLNHTDILLRDNISKAFNSKTLADTLSVSVVNIVAPSLEKCYRDIISSSLIPSWERVCGQMFQQINETFTRGTKEYTASVESYMDKQRRVQEKGKDLIVQMQTVSDTMKTNADKLTSTLTSELHKQFNIVFKSMNDKLVNNIRDVISDQVKEGFKNHATVFEDSVMNAVRSRAVTPSPHVDTHAITMNQIQHLLLRNNYDDAFQLALSAENLSYVIYVCERVDIQTLFGDECLLQQSCLLALIQQLSMELNKNTDLKLSYIRAGFLCVLPDCPTTKNFIPKVLKDLLKQLNNFCQSNPPMKQLKEAKLIKMAVESMLVK